MTGLIHLCAAVLCLAACVAVTPCLAHDVVIPPWRGTPGSTFQGWGFDSSANPAVPELVSNSYGTPSANISVGPYGSGWFHWLPGMGTQTGYWDMGSAGIITLSVPNKPDAPAGSSTWIAVQTTYFRDIVQAPVLTVTGAARLRTETRIVETVPTGGDWRLDQSYWRLATSPSTNIITLTSSSQWGAVIDHVVIDTVSTQAVTTVGAAKQTPDGAAVEVTGPVVSRVFESYFYIEDTLRVAGIRVNCDPSMLPQEGTVPTLVGTIRTIDGERVLDQSLVIPGPSAAIPAALAMNGLAPSIGLSPQGLRVMLWGRAQVTPGADTFMISDGSGEPAQRSLPVRVELHGVAAPPNGSYVRVTGVLGADQSGPVLRVNPRDSLQWSL